MPADLTDPAAVLAHPQIQQTIDLAQPVGIVMACTLHFLAAGQAKHVTAAYMDRAVPTSQIAISVVHIASASLRATPRETYTAGTFFRHGPAEMTDWLAGWQILPPGVAEARRWVSGIGGAPCAADSYILCATASKPQN